MATFKKNYTVSELLRKIDNHTIIPFCWRNGDQIPQFYFVDARRCPEQNNSGDLCFCTHKSNYYRFVNKIYFLPFRLRLLLGDEITYYYSLEVCPTISGNPFYYDSLTELKRLAEVYSDDFKVASYIL